MDSPPTSPWRAWSWVPSLYFCQAVPYVAVVALSVPMYKRLGVSNADLAFWTSWLYLPWVIKPLWAPLVDRFRTKRAWIWSLQFFVGAGLVFAGITDTCGMGMMLARMPWNRRPVRATVAGAGVCAAQPAVCAAPPLASAHPTCAAPRAGREPPHP